MLKMLVTAELLKAYSDISNAWETCDEAYEFAINTQPEFKAFACFDSAHYIKYRDNILSW